MSIFDTIQTAPADPILGLTDAFKADPRAGKINLGVGVFIDETGVTPVLESAAEAEKRLVSQTTSKSYLPITGTPVYGELTRELAFGDQLASSLKGRWITAQTPGGTGALRVAADFIAQNLSGSAIWMPSPTWANHGGIFHAAGLQTSTYPYFDAASNGVQFSAMLDALRRVPASDVVLLHACCHNPTGADLTAEQWQEVIQLASEKGWLPLIDFAYQGFGDGLEQDAVSVRGFAAAGIPCLVAHSFSKNFGLYQDRVGALHVLADSEEAAARIGSQIKVAIRTNYSNPPAHGAAIVSTILQDVALRGQWVKEVDAMRDRINGVREQFVQALAASGVSRDFSFLRQQRGMFSFTGISREHVRVLREEHAVYMVDSGRINVAGITGKNLPALVQAIRTVLG